MKLKIAVCDDEGSQRDYLAETVFAWAKKNRHMAELLPYTNAKAFLFAYAQEKDFDILLLDVEMPEMSGVELAKKVRCENQAVQI
ncbi:MAG: response regulator, partial [Lachnospiraceae bacterium]|nr:response regulator [Lachnospiraceae bacterium]